MTSHEGLTERLVAACAENLSTAHNCMDEDQQSAAVASATIALTQAVLAHLAFAYHGAADQPALVFETPLFVALERAIAS